MRLTRYLLLLPFFFTALSAYSQNPKASKKDTTSKERKPKTSNKDTTLTFTFTERMPSFPGGEEALNKFIWKNLLLPDMDTRYSARLKFIVQSDGNIRRQSITIDGRTPDTSNAMDKALLQMIAKMPLWIPAKQGGHAVHCYTAIPILCIMPQE